MLRLESQKTNEVAGKEDHIYLVLNYSGKSKKKNSKTETRLCLNVSDVLEGIFTLLNKKGKEKVIENIRSNLQIFEKRISTEDDKINIDSPKKEESALTTKDSNFSAQSPVKRTLFTPVHSNVSATTSAVSSESAYVSSPVSSLPLLFPSSFSVPPVQPVASLQPVQPVASLQPVQPVSSLPSVQAVASVQPVPPVLPKLSLSELVLRNTELTLPTEESREVFSSASESDYIEKHLKQIDIELIRECASLREERKKKFSPSFLPSVEVKYHEEFFERDFPHYEENQTVLKNLSTYRYQTQNSIISYGVILYHRENGQSTEFLISQRRNSIAYIDFLRGRIEYFKLPYYFLYITPEERYRLLNYKFSDIWDDLLLLNKSYKKEYKEGERIFNYLKRRGTLEKLCKDVPLVFEETMWGFPKGRKRTDKESDIEAALREFKEETNLDFRNIILQDVPPVFVNYLGTDGNSYSNVFFFAESLEKLNIKYKYIEKTIRHHTISEEIGCLMWRNITEARKKLYRSPEVKLLEALKQL